MCEQVGKWTQQSTPGQIWNCLTVAVKTCNIELLRTRKQEEKLLEYKKEETIVRNTTGS